MPQLNFKGHKAVFDDFSNYWSGNCFFGKCFLFWLYKRPRWGLYLEDPTGKASVNHVKLGNVRLDYIRFKEIVITHTTVP